VPDRLIMRARLGVGLGRGADPHPAGEQAVLAPGVQVGEEDGDGLADKPAAVDHDTKPTQHQAGVL
jgi:hypothetical protein